MPWNRNPREKSHSIVKGTGGDHSIPAKHQTLWAEKEEIPSNNPADQQDIRGYPCKGEEITTHKIARIAKAGGVFKSEGGASGSFRCPSAEGEALGLVLWPRIHWVKMGMGQNGLWLITRGFSNHFCDTFGNPLFIGGWSLGGHFCSRKWSFPTALESK